jgi:hypothetical protein
VKIALTLAARTDFILLGDMGVSQALQEEIARVKRGQQLQAEKFIVRSSNILLE